MPRGSTTDRQCKFCSLFLSGDEFHEEFDFYKHPAVKETLRELKKRYETLAPEQQMYRMENWAVKRNPPLRRNATITLVDGIHQKPEGGTVVMPGYGRLVEADIWLRKLEESDSKIVDSQIQGSSALPF